MKKYILFPLLLISLLLHWYSYGSGLHLTDDSRHYLAAVESLKESFSFIDKDGHAFLFWPPLFPLILTIVGVQGLIWLNYVLAVSIAFVSYRIARRIIQHETIRIFYFIYVLLGVHILLISTFLWSELIFLFLMLLFIDQFQLSHESKVSFYVAIIVGFLMCLQRNAGIFIVTGVSFWIFLNEAQWKQKIVRATAFFLSVASGCIGWNIYVWAFVPHHHFTFSETPFQFAWANTEAVAQAMLTTFFPIPFLIIPALLIFVIALFLLLMSDLKNNSYLQQISLVSIVYSLFLYLVVIINIGGFPVDFGEGDRFISVIVPFMGIIFFKAVEKVFDQQERTFKIVFLILIVCWMTYPLSRTIKNAILWHDTGITKPKVLVN
jgi:hypothetical protein